MKQKLRVEYDSKKCIGAAQCAAIDPKHFSLRNGKATLASAKQEQGIAVLEGEFETKEATRLEHAAASCPSNAIRVVDVESRTETVTNTVQYTRAYEEIEAEYDDAKEFVLDPKGYFLIRINNKKKEIEVAFCTMRNQIAYKIVGKKPIDIYMTILKKGIIKRPDHAAYLGRELQKAYDALQTGVEYVQDSDLDFSKKES